MRQGFTLLELIVVLAILGMATALVAPSMIRGIDSWKRQAQLDALFDQVRALPGNARASGRSILVDQGSLESEVPPLRVDGDWVLRVERPWKVNANGVCGDGEVSIGNDHGSKAVLVVSPFCQPELKP